MRLHLWHLLESIAGEEAEGWKWTPVTGNGLIFTCQKGSSHGFATLVKTKPLGTWQMDQTIHLSNSHSHLVTCATFGITSIYSVQLGKLRLIKCKKWGQGLCGSNFSIVCCWSFYGSLGGNTKQEYRYWDTCTWQAEQAPLYSPLQPHTTYFQIQVQQTGIYHWLFPFLQ